MPATKTWHYCPRPRLFNHSRFLQSYFWGCDGTRHCWPHLVPWLGLTLSLHRHNHCFTDNGQTWSCTVALRTLASPLQTAHQLWSCRDPAFQIFDSSSALATASTQTLTEWFRKGLASLFRYLKPHGKVYTSNPFVLQDHFFKKALLSRDRKSL